MASLAEIARAFALGAFVGVSVARAAIEMVRGDWTDAAFTVVILGLAAVALPWRTIQGRR